MGALGRPALGERDVLRVRQLVPRAAAALLPLAARAQQRARAQRLRPTSSSGTR